MRLRNLADVKVEVVAAGTFDTPWKHGGPGPIRIINPLNDAVEVELYPSGELNVYPGYLCDGPSGPTIDDATNRIPAVVHDVAYQLLRMGINPPSLTRKSADEVIRDMMLAHGAWSWRARAWYRGLRMFGWRAAKRTSKLPKKYTYLEA